MTYFFILFALVAYSNALLYGMDTSQDETHAFKSNEINKESLKFEAYPDNNNDNAQAKFFSTSLTSLAKELIALNNNNNQQLESLHRNIIGLKTAQINEKLDTYNGRIKVNEEAITQINKTLTNLSEKITNATNNNEEAQKNNLFTIKTINERLEQISNKIKDLEDNSKKPNEGLESIKSNTLKTSILKQLESSSSSKKSSSSTSIDSLSTKHNVYLVEDRKGSIEKEAFYQSLLALTEVNNGTFIDKNTGNIISNQSYIDINSIVSVVKASPRVQQALKKDEWFWNRRPKTTILATALVGTGVGIYLSQHLTTQTVIDGFSNLKLKITN